MDILNYLILDEPLLEWLVVLGIGIGISIALMLLRRIVVNRFEKLAARTSNVVDDVIVVVLKSTKRFSFLVVGLWMATMIRQFLGTWSAVMQRTVFLVLLLQIGIWGTALVSWWLKYYRAQKIEKDPSAVTTITAMGMLAKIGLWSVLLLAAMDNFGIDVTALITGLGIGGIAVALAVQNILGDIFASLSIVLDKPFVVGDFLVIGDFKGNVEYIGLKTTRMRSLSGEQIVISNSDLLTSRIRNFKRMYRRRAVFSVGVQYDTPREQLQAIPGMIKGCLEKHEHVSVDRVHFATYGDSALLFEAVYYLEDPDYNLYMDVQQAVNLDLLDRFGAAGIDIAFPTQKLYVEMEKQTS